MERVFTISCRAHHLLIVESSGESTKGSTQAYIMNTRIPHMSAPMITIFTVALLCCLSSIYTDKHLEQGRTRIDFADNCVYTEDSLNIGLQTEVQRPTRYIAVSKYKHAGTRSGLPGTGFNINKQQRTDEFLQELTND